MVKFKRVTPFFVKTSIVYHTLLYVTLVLSLFINYAEYSGFLGIQAYGEQMRVNQQIAQEAADKKAAQLKAEAEAKEIKERMMAAIENPPQPVELKKKGK